MKPIPFLLSVLLALPAMAQAPAFCHVPDPADPHWDIDDYDPKRDADDWCKLAHNEPHKAKRELAKAVALVRGENNLNRFYFDPKQGSTPGLYVQLLRDWMKDADGRPRWKVARWVHRGRVLSGHATSLTHRVVIADLTDPARFSEVSLIGAHYDSTIRADFSPPLVGGSFNGQVPDLRVDVPPQVGYAAVFIWARCSSFASSSVSAEGRMPAAAVKTLVEGILDQPGALGCD